MIISATRCPVLFRSFSAALNAVVNPDIIVLYNSIMLYELGVDRLSAPILSIFTIIDIGHFQNRFADFFFFANKHTIYR